MGPISPDGKRLLNYKGNRLNLLDLETGAMHSLENGLEEGNWSPDGRWIAASGSGRNVRIDAMNISQRRNLGRQSGFANQLEWAPDSKHLLLLKSAPWACGGQFESLEILDVESGKRSMIKSSHCAVSYPYIGWIDPESVR